MKQKEWLLDHLIKDAIELDMKNSPPPLRSKAETWADIQQQLQSPASTAKKTGRYFRISAAALIIVVLFSLVAFQQKQAYAWNWVIGYFTQVQGSITQLFISQRSTPSDGEMLPVMESLDISHGGVRFEYMGLDEAQESTAFPIAVPKTVPDDYVLKHVKLSLIDEEKSKDIELIYSDGTETFLIRQMQSAGQSFYSLSMDNEDTLVHNERIGETQVYWLEHKNGHRSMTWSLEKMQYIIEGPLSDEEFLTVYRAMM